MQLRVHTLWRVEICSSCGCIRCGTEVQQRRKRACRARMHTRAHVCHCPCDAKGAASSLPCVHLHTHVPAHLVTMRPITLGPCTFDRHRASRRIAGW